eukprot:6209969-Pleurochrysis_carterae.AAC.1
MELLTSHCTLTAVTCRPGGKIMKYDSNNATRCAASLPNLAFLGILYSKFYLFAQAYTWSRDVAY